MGNLLNLKNVLQLNMHLFYYSPHLVKTCLFSVAFSLISNKSVNDKQGIQIEHLLIFSL